MHRIVVIGGTGLIGSKTIARLTADGHTAVPATPSTGVNTITGEGLADVLTGANVLVDVSNSPSFADADVMAFFVTSTTNLIAAAKAAGVGHYVALSVVGSDRLVDSGYMKAKVEQEKLIKASGIPYTLIHATQFFEFIGGIAASSAVADEVRLPNGPVQPIAAADVATEVARVAEGAPVNGTVEIAGPEVMGLADFVRAGLTFRKDPRVVVTDETALYFGAIPGPHTLIPSAGATIFETRLAEWLPANS
jgi:uncharacterized protein YbjT (DUF2867 family)